MRARLALQVRFLSTMEAVWPSKSSAEPYRVVLLFSKMTFFTLSFAGPISTLAIHMTIIGPEDLGIQECHYQATTLAFREFYLYLESLGMML